MVGMGTLQALALAKSQLPPNSQKGHLPATQQTQCLPWGRSHLLQGKTTQVLARSFPSLYGFWSSNVAIALVSLQVSDVFHGLADEVGSWDSAFPYYRHRKRHQSWHSHPIHFTAFVPKCVFCCEWKFCYVCTRESSQFRLSGGAAPEAVSQSSFVDPPDWVNQLPSLA